jgi:hypothetical protein
LQFQCKQCLAVADLPAGTNPHAHNWCQCCTLTGEDGEIHHHGDTTLPAEQCEQENHPGEPCWHPPTQPNRPDGCTVCRPVIHLATVGEVLPAGAP